MSGENFRLDLKVPAATKMLFDQSDFPHLLKPTVLQLLFLSRKMGNPLK
jgi:hypothetical protein